MLEDLRKTLHAPDSTWVRGRRKLLHLLVVTVLDLREEKPESIEQVLSHTQEVLELLKEDSAKYALALEALVAPDHRRSYGAWWFLTEVLMDMMPGTQTVRRGNAARAQMASIMAAAVQAGYLSMVEGVIDGLDAMTNPCLPLKDPKAKFVCGPRHWNPLLVAEHYFDNMLPGQAKGAVHTQSHKAVLENAWSSAMSDSMTADLAKAIASQMERDAEAAADTPVPASQQPRMDPGDTIEDPPPMWWIIEGARYAGYSTFGRDDGDVIKYLPGHHCKSFCNAQALQWLTMGQQKRCQIVGGCLLTLLERLRVHYCIKDIPQGPMSRLRHRWLQRLLQEVCRPISSWGGFVAIALQLLPKLLQSSKEDVDTTPVFGMVAFYLSTLVVLRVQTLHECLNQVNDLDELTYGYTVQSKILWKLRLHLVEIVNNRIPPCHPACPELDADACFVGQGSVKAAEAGLIREATATAAAKSMGSPGKKQQRNPASGLEASRQAAAEAAALQAAAALLEQEERAAEVSHQAKQRSASKKARQKQRQQAKAALEHQADGQPQPSADETARYQLDVAAAAGSQPEIVTPSPEGTKLPHPLAELLQTAGSAAGNGTAGIEDHGSIYTKPDTDSMQQEPECIICWEATADVLLQPCGHLCTCVSCATHIPEASGLCPMCRCRVLSRIVLQL